ncbi:MAG: NACHT domain-containing protein, partial [Chroococcidiopsidaceae cyanobacterium CP_BM_RX_35]|nr:NACHT domain-containing protein [Chroococcidiopsidaceae cyanobacterium CP_BM_RX_35]
MNFEEILQILDKVVFAKHQRHLKDVEKFVFHSAWQGQTYEEMARASHYQYTPNYLKHCIGPRFWRFISETLEEDICKTNFRAALARLVQLHAGSQVRGHSVEQLEKKSARATTNPAQDWGEAVEVFAFYGREAELALLEQWISTQRCWLILLQGMGGIGKTALAVKLVKQVQDGFEYVIWRSLRNAPPLMAILSELIAFLSQQEETDLPDTLDARLLRLMHYLRSHRCLLLLDNIEPILRSGARCGCYAEGHEGYGQLFRYVGQMPHQSCLVLTSREQPKGLATLEDETLTVRSLKLTGLPLAEGRKIFQQQEKYSGSEAEWELVISHYAGNPLALKMVAIAIQDLFESNLSKFIALLKQGTLVFRDIGDLIERQFNRLSDLEQEVMYWLAINHEPCSLAALQAD